MDNIRKQIMLLTWMMQKTDNNPKAFSAETVNDDFAEFLYLCLEPGETVEDLTLQRLAAILVDAIRFHLGTIDAIAMTGSGWSTEQVLQYYGKEASK